MNESIHIDNTFPVFYDKVVWRVKTVKTYNDDTGLLQVDYRLDSYFKCNIQQNSGAINPKEFGKEYDASYRLSCPASVSISKSDFILYDNMAYTIVDFTTTERSKIILIKEYQTIDEFGKDKGIYGPKEITHSGEYNAVDDDLDGYNKVTVSYPKVTKEITKNGMYNAADEGLDGYSNVNVNLALGEKEINANGTYNAADDNLKGYSSVNVNIHSRDWEAIGYKAEPSIIESAYQEGLKIKNNFDPSASTQPHFNLTQYTFFPSLDFSNATSFNNMFSGQSYLLTMGKPLNIEHVNNTADMFGYATDLKEAELPDMKNVENSRGMFYYCEKLINLIGEIDLSVNANVSDMFSKCLSLKEVTLKNGQNVVKAGSIFEGCHSLQRVNGIESIGAHLTDASRMFYECYNLEYLPPLSLPKVASLSSTFATRIDYGGYPYTGNTHIKEIILNNLNSLTDRGLEQTFNGLDAVEKITLKGIPSGVYPISRFAFYSCGKLKEIEVDNNKIGLNSNCENSFGSCYSLTKIPDLVLKEPTSLYNVFTDCGSLTEAPNIENSSFITNMHYAFAWCKQMTSVPAYDVGNVTDFQVCFIQCGSLKYIHMKNIGANLIISDTALEHDGLVEVIGNLKTVTSTHTLTMGSKKLALLSDPEKQVAIDKGWTLA